MTATTCVVREIRLGNRSAWVVRVGGRPAGVVTAEAGLYAARLVGAVHPYCRFPTLTAACRAVGRRAKDASAAAPPGATDPVSHSPLPLAV
jgi:hypothetical protein